MKLSSVPKKSIAAAVCAALLCAFQVYSIISSIRVFYPSAAIHTIVLDLLATLLALAMYVWFLVPNNRLYRAGLAVILSLLVFRRIAYELMIQVPRTPLGILSALLHVSVYILLLIGVLANKRTEKPAGVMSAVQAVFSFALNFWPMADNMLAQGVPVRIVVINAALGLFYTLPGLLLAAALLLHPVTARPMLQPEEKETVQIHE